MDNELCGVTSGAPTPEGFILWTRVPAAHRHGLAAGEELAVAWEVSSAESFGAGAIVARGRATTSEAADFTVKVRVEGLAPDRFYWYRFSTEGGYASDVGRARTAPLPDAARELTIASVSCQSFSAGFYPAFRSLAGMAASVDYVVHLGDHIYEKDSGRPGSPDPLGRRECRSLADYRRKYRYYLSDPAYREARRLFTWIDLWDDHEVVNNFSSVDVGRDTARFHGAFQAFSEYMPIAGAVTLAADGRPRLPLRDKLRLGAYVELFVVDQRQYRDAMPCEDDFLVSPCPAARAASHSMLGAAQKAWLKEGLASSSARWRLVMSEVMVSQFNVPDRKVLNLDAWDGFPAERLELLEHVRRHCDDVVFVTGDIHSAYQSVVHADPGDLASPAVAVEVVTSAVSSWPLAGSMKRALGADYNAIVRRENPQFKWLDFESNGFTLLKFTAAEMAVTHVASDARSADGASRVTRQARVAAGRPAFTA